MKEKVLRIISEIFRKELGDENLVITYDSSPASVDKWDSASNLLILSAIEEKFNIVFPVEFIFSADNVGDICTYIAENSQVINQL